MNKTKKRFLLTPFNALYRIAPELDTKLLWRLKHHSKIDLKNPKTYNEKVNWLKLFYRNELMPICADKFKAREYIESFGLGNHLPKLYWHGDDPEKIPFNELPSKYVIKSTTGSGNNLIITDKRTIDKKKIIKTVKLWMREKYLIAYGEWHYEKIQPSIIIEEFLDDHENPVPFDYKFFCFNNIKDGKGSVGCIAVDVERFNGHKRLIFNTDWVFLKDVRFSFSNEYDFKKISKPMMFDEMVKVASILSKPFPHCRVDFYCIGNDYYIGEITFFNGAGFDIVTPKEYNLLMGDWITLPQKP